MLTSSSCLRHRTDIFTHLLVRLLFLLPSRLLSLCALQSDVTRPVTLACVFLCGFLVYGAPGPAFSYPSCSVSSVAIPGPSGTRLYALNAEGNGTTVGTNVQLWADEVTTLGNQWVVLPVTLYDSIPGFVFASSLSGLVLSVDGTVREGANVHLADFTGQVPGDVWVRSGGWFIAPASQPDLGLNVSGGSFAPGTNVQLWSNESGGEANEWDFDDCVSTAYFYDPGCSSTSELGGPPEYTGQTNPPEGPSVCLGSAAIPFVMIEDPTRSPADQVKESPMYTLAYSEYWQYDNGSLRINKTGTAQKKIVKAAKGMSLNTSTSMSKTLGFSVTVEAGGTFKAVSASMSATVYGELNMTETRSETYWQQEEEIIHLELDANSQAVTYILVALWELYDLTGHKIAHWEAPTENRAYLGYSLADKSQIPVAHTESPN